MHYMRILAVALGLSLVGCITGEIGDTGGGGGGGGGDDDGSGSGSGSGELTPRLTVTVDKPTVATELGKSETVTLTFTSVDGFAGDVTVTSSMLDAVSQPVAVMAPQGPATVSVAAGQTATAAFKVDIPSNLSGADYAATLKLDLSSSAGPQTISSTFNVAAIYTVTYAANTGTTANTHASTGLDVTVKRGAKLRFHNSDAIEHITHGEGGFPHEDTGAGGSPNGTYDVETIATPVGTVGRLGCHSHGSATYGTFRVE